MKLKGEVYNTVLNDKEKEKMVGLFSEEQDVQSVTKTESLLAMWPMTKDKLSSIRK